VSAEPSVLQVVILRDGLLVGTEVFVPGHYALGSGLDQDLRLDDASVQAAHAELFFQNGRAAVQDAGSNALFVNGHRVTACEVRAVDEIVVGPFTLKVRVMARRPVARPTPSAEVAAILGAPPPPPRPSAPPVPSSPRPPGPPATVVSNRRMTAAPLQEPAPSRPLHLRTVPPPPEPDEAASLEDDFFSPAASAPPGLSPQALFEDVGLPTTPGLGLPAAAARPSAPAARPSAPTPRASAPAPRASAPPQAARTSAPRLPSPEGARGQPRLFVELFWGDTRHVARSFRTLAKQGLLAGPSDELPLPLWGFELPEGFVFAEQAGEGYRVHVPPGASVERRAQDGELYAAPPETLEAGRGQGHAITLGPGHAARFLGDGGVSVLAYVQAPLPRPFVNPLRGLPWLMLACLALFGGGLAAFFSLAGSATENPDFQARNLNPVAVKLIAPPKPEERKRIAEKVQRLKKPDKAPEKKVEAPRQEKPLPKAVAQETRKALKSVERLTAAGPAMKDLLAAVDKLGSGPGLKGLKNDFKLSGLIGKQPIAAAGIGTFGLGGGGSGGSGIKGLEVLRGKGGGGIGALGAGNVGKGSVAGTVTHAVSRSVAAQGSVDKEAVARVINAHLNEVSSCYERALLKTPGLAGKIVLEWQITTSGSVGTARTKTSTMQSAAVESCILGVLKQWRFPPAAGAGVVITYPFMFNSVGY
jgi:hypothetical protein